MNRISHALTAAPLRPDYADAGDFMRVASVGFIGWYHIWQQSWLNPNPTILGHTFDIYHLVSCGYMFVDLMLLLSGFLLMLGWLNGRSRSLRSFYTARAARILPSYLLCMAIMLFGFALPRGLYRDGGHMWTDILAHLSFTHNLFRDSHSFTQLNGALWTLAVEVQFYLIFPLLARWFERRPARTYGCMAALAIGVRIAIALLAQSNDMFVNRLPAMLDVYANGMLAAWIYKRLAEKPQRAWRAWLSTALTLLSAAAVFLIIRNQMSWRGGDTVRLGQMFWRFPLSAAGAVFLVCGSRSIGLLRALLSNGLVRFLSGISFNFYIWHQFLAVKLKELRIPPYAGENPNQAGLQPWQWQYTLCCFAAAILTAVLITYLVEKPCAKRIKRALKAKDT